MLDLISAFTFGTLVVHVALAKLELKHVHEKLTYMVKSNGGNGEGEIVSREGGRGESVVWCVVM